MVSSKLTPLGRLVVGDHKNSPIPLPVTREQYLDPTFIPRLSFRLAPRTRTDVGDLIAHIGQLSDHAIFLDTNLTWLDDEWWDALLSEPGRVHITGRVLHELIPFLKRNPNHPLRPALAERNPAIVLHVDPNDEAGENVFHYYRRLLSYRRHLLASASRQFEAKHGRQPSREDMTALKMQLQRFAGERTLRLNTKPVSQNETDEALAFLAVHHAVKTGQRTKIFSGDSDVEEQFYAMIRLLTAHYYGGVLGHRYAADFTSFRPRALPPALMSKYGRLFEPHNATIIDLGRKGIHDFIPIHTTVVPVSCATIGKEYVSELVYGAETTMAEVFTTKATTLGLSTDKLGGRNVHPWLVPEELLLPDSYGALVAFDKCVSAPRTAMRLAQLDIMMTMWPGDPHANVEGIEATAT